MKCVFEIKGKQYNITEENQVIFIDYQEKAKPGEKIIFDKVLSYEGEFGQPYLKKQIIAEVIKHGQKAKIHVFRYKAKKRYKTNKQSNRRGKNTRIKVISIEKI